MSDKNLFLKELKNAAVKVEQETPFNIHIMMASSFDTGTYYFRAVRNGWDAVCVGRSLRIFFE